MSNTNTDDTQVTADMESWSVEHIYDVLMYDIEPELMRAMIPELDSLYKDETEEERAARMKHYDECLQEFDRRFEKFMTLLKRELKSFEKDTIQAFKDDALGSSEKNILSLIET